ncbi:MAG: putative MarR-family transcriptional regulator [Acidimicrobiaceae bacterium]|nr:putative MarR-family transcriptional regulator [Acidimicrobiaceae bacterium]
MPKATISPKRVAGCSPNAAELDQITASLQVLSRYFNQARTHELLLREAGVRIDRAGVILLYKLRYAKGALRISELAELLSIDTPGVTRKVQQLERLGYVSIQPEVEDKRAKRVALTASGDETLQRVLAAGKNRLGRLLADWTRPEIEELTLSMGKFADALKKEMESNRE